MRIPWCILYVWLSAILCLCCGRSLAQGDQMDPAFEQFRNNLEQVIGKNNLQNNAYHFVVLFNMANPTGPKHATMIRIYESLVTHYLVENKSGQGDWISFIPFQNEPWEDNPRYRNNHFTNAAVKDFINLRRSSKNSDNNQEMGHDIEKAVCYAVEHVDDPRKAILIVLSDNANSDNREGIPLTASMSGWDQVLRDHRIGIKGHEEHKGTEENGKGSAGDAYFRIYYAADLMATATLSKPRSELVVEEKSTTPNPNPNPPYDGKHPDDGKHHYDPIPWLDWIGYGVLAIVILGGIAYGVWLVKPRSVQITSQGASTPPGSVTFGNRYLVGGEGCQFILPGLAKGQRIASLEVTLTGSVIMKSEGIYQVGSKGQAVIGTKAATVSVTNVQNKNQKFPLIVKRLS